ncbi:MAG: putative porin [Lysobacterales bacterium]
MKKLAALIGLGVFLCSPATPAQVSEEEIQALRAQIETLTRRLDELERQSRQPAPSDGEAPAAVQAAPTAATAGTLAQTVDDKAVDEKIDRAVAERVDERLAGLSWAERMRWNGDFRYRYENSQTEGQEDRNRNRIRARAHLEADVSPTVQVGFGLATGGDDPVSANQTLGGGGSTKDVGLDLAYFAWSGLADTQVVGGKFENFLVRPAKSGLLWDGDWRPEGFGLAWSEGRFFAQGLGTWLEGDSRNGTEFAWVVQAGMNLTIGDDGRLKFGAGYNQIDSAGATPLFGDPDDFYGNSYVPDPVSGDLVFAYDFHQIEAFAEYTSRLGGRPLTLFADYVINTDADANDSGYLFGARYGAAKAPGSWDVGWFYKKLEADATLGLLTDSDFGGGGTDARGHVFSGTYGFHANWNVQLTWFLTETDLTSGNPKDVDTVMLDLNFKYE